MVNSNKGKKKRENDYRAQHGEATVTQTNSCIRETEKKIKRVAVHPITRKHLVEKQIEKTCKKKKDI